MNALQIKLEPLGTRHLEKTFRWVNDHAIAKPMNLLEPIAWETHLEWFKGISEDNNRLYFAIEVGGEYMGNCGLKNINTDGRSRKAELWTYVAPEYQGRGIGLQAVQALLKIAFEELKLHRVYLYALAFNGRAIRLYTKAGFTIEGFFRKDVFLDGEYHDSVWMGILAEEFKKDELRREQKNAKTVEPPSAASRLSK